MDPPPPAPTPTTDSLDSLNSSQPTSDSHPPTNSVPKLRFMCSFGGHIVPRPHDKSLCYVGGDTRIVVVDRNASLSDLIAKLSKTLVSTSGNCGGFVLKYQLPSEDLDSLISVSTDEDLENMVEEYDRLGCNSGKGLRIRLFLFPVKQEMNSSLLESSIKSEDWFLSALNGGSSVGGLSGSNSVNSLLGLNDEVVVGGKGGIGGVVGKNVDVHSVVESLDRNSSFGSDVHLSGVGGLAPVRVKEEKVGGEENVGGDGNGNGNGNVKVEDGGFAGSDVGKVAVAANVSLEKVVGENVGRGLSDDEKSEHGGMGYGRQLQQQQAQLMAAQLNQKASGGGGGRDLASPVSVSLFSAEEKIWTTSRYLERWGHVIYSSRQRLTAAQVLAHPWIKEDGEAPDTPLDNGVLSRLKQFKAMNEFKKVALWVIAKGLSEEEIMGLKQMFKSMDADNSGTITLEELKQGFAQQGTRLSEYEVKQLMEAADAYGDGTINYDEFITATMHMNRMDREDHLYTAFQSFDKDNSGTSFQY